MGGGRAPCAERKDARDQVFQKDDKTDGQRRADKRLDNPVEHPYLHAADDNQTVDAECRIENRAEKQDAQVSFHTELRDKKIDQRDPDAGI